MEGVSTLQDQIDKVNARKNAAIESDSCPNSGVVVGQQATSAPKAVASGSAQSAQSATNMIVEDEDAVRIESSRSSCSLQDGDSPPIEIVSAHLSTADIQQSSVVPVRRYPIRVTKPSQKMRGVLEAKAVCMTDTSSSSENQSKADAAAPAISSNTQNGSSSTPVNNKRSASDGEEQASKAIKLTNINEVAEIVRTVSQPTVASAPQANSGPIVTQVSARQQSNDTNVNNDEEPFVRPSNKHRAKNSTVTAPLEPVSTQNRFNMLAQSKGQTKPNTKQHSATGASTSSPEASTSSGSRQSTVKQHTTKNGTSVLTEKIKSQESPEPKEIRPPAITITGTDYNTVCAAIGNHGFVFDWNLAQENIRIVMKTEEMRLAALDILEEKGIHCFSHMPASDGRFCTVIRGLPKSDLVPQALFDELNTLELDPIEVREIRTNRSALYAVDFHRNSISLSFLQKNIRMMMYHTVKWEAAKRKDNGPVQCRRCLMYGHGSLFCRRPAVCANCACAHRSEDCPEVFEPPAQTTPTAPGQPPVPEPTEFIPPYRCVHCAALRPDDLLFACHSALSTNCSVRLAKKESQRARRANYERKLQEQNAASNGPGRVARSNGYPPIVNRKRRQNVADDQSTPRSRRPGNFMPAPAPLPPLINFNQVVRDGLSPAQLRAQLKEAAEKAAGRAAGNVGPLSGHPAGALWTTQEVVAIMMNALNDLSRCNSKQDQMSVIVNLISKCLD